MRELQAQMQAQPGCYDTRGTGTPHRGTHRQMPFADEHDISRERHGNKPGSHTETMSTERDDRKRGDSLEGRVHRHTSEGIPDRVDEPGPGGTGERQPIIGAGSTPDFGGIMLGIPSKSHA